MREVEVLSGEVRLGKRTSRWIPCEATLGRVQTRDV